MQQNAQWTNVEKNGSQGKTKSFASSKSLIEKISIRWFRLIRHEVTGQDVWISNEKYWQRNWTNCPDIY